MGSAVLCLCAFVVRSTRHACAVQLRAFRPSSPEAPRGSGPGSSQLRPSVHPSLPLHGAVAVSLSLPVAAA